MGDKNNFSYYGKPLHEDVILCELSSTQRIAVNVYNSCIIIHKDFRKTSEEDWIVAKGIRIPITDLKKVANKLLEFVPEE